MLFFFSFNEKLFDASDVEEIQKDHNTVRALPPGFRSTAPVSVLVVVVKQFYWSRVKAVIVGVPSLAQSLYDVPFHLYGEKTEANVSKFYFHLPPLLFVFSCNGSLILLLAFWSTTAFFLSVGGLKGPNLKQYFQIIILAFLPVSANLAVTNKWRYVKWYHECPESDHHQPECRQTADLRPAAPCEQRGWTSTAGISSRASHQWKEGNQLRLQGLNSNIKMWILVKSLLCLTLSFYN